MGAWRSLPVPRLILPTKLSRVLTRPPAVRRVTAPGFVCLSAPEPASTPGPPTAVRYSAHPSASGSEGVLWPGSKPPATEEGGSGHQMLVGSLSAAMGTHPTTAADAPSPSVRGEHVPVNAFQECRRDRGGRRWPRGPPRRFGTHEKRFKDFTLHLQVGVTRVHHCGRDEWAWVAPLPLKPAKRGRRASADLREVTGAIRLHDAHGLRLAHAAQGFPAPADGVLGGSDASCS